jgi:N-acetylmuramoyl-L-alanine amidase
MRSISTSGEAMTVCTSRSVALVVAVVLGVSAVAVPLGARAASARDRYEEALALDRRAREAGDAPGEADERAARTARRALGLYESVVRRYPTSGYCDNALMRGGDLARWLFTRTGRATDRATAAKYYTWLVREYPGSGLRGQARTAARALDTLSAAVARPRTAALSVATVRAAATAALPAAASPVTVLAGVATGAGPTAPPTLRGIDRAVVNGAVRVTLMLDRETAFTHEVLAGPPRAFVDLFGTAPAADLQDALLRYDTDAVRQVRVGRRPGATRVVLDLDGAPAVSVFTLYNPFRVVIDAERTAASTAVAASAVPALLPALPVAAPVAMPAVLRDDVPAAPRDENDVVPTAAPVAVVPVTREFDPPVIYTPIIAPVALPTPAPSLPTPAMAPPTPRPVVVDVMTPAVEDEPDVPAPAVPAVNTDGSFSLARQLGLGISRIVIDPGHGGHDPGTLTAGSNEARLVLDVALRLEKLLKKEPGLEVALTRRTDVFIPLEQRTAIANREGADLFLSIHANASRDPAARGVETYFLSFASNPEAEAVAARENATSASDMHNLPSIVRAIALNNKLDESRDLAALVQQSLTARLSKTNPTLRSRGVKKAPFVVLIGAGMPSVLAEIGFITNKQESALVKTPAYRQRIAESLHAAVMQYRRALKRQTSVAAR